MKYSLVSFIILAATQSFAASIDGSYKLETLGCSSGVENTGKNYITGSTVTMKDGKGTVTVCFKALDGKESTGVTGEFDYYVNGESISIVSKPDNTKTQGYVALAGSNLVIVSKTLGTTSTSCPVGDSVVSVYTRIQ